MKTKLKYLSKVSLYKKIKTKWFAIVNVILLILIVGLINIDSIINFFGGSFGEETEIIVVDKTEEAFPLFKEAMLADNMFSEIDVNEIKITKSKQTEKKAKAAIENNKKIVVVLETDPEVFLKSRIIVKSRLDLLLEQRLMTALNSVKTSFAIAETKIDVADLMKINTPMNVEKFYLDKDKTETDAHMELLLTVIFPVLILPFFMLIIFLVQMIGAEINEEKTTRGMEIIISNVSPRIHFLAKIIAGNAFVFIQAGLLFGGVLLGFFVRRLTNPGGSLLPATIDLNAFWLQLVETGFLEKIVYLIPLVLLLLVLSFIAYSLLAGILASMTTSMEDYQQLQAPIALISLAGYYLAMIAPVFEGSLFIRFVSYLPFLSALLSPILLLIGQIGVIDVIISIFILSGLIFLMITYGLRVYKVGILNYSTSKLWLRMVKALKEEP